MPSENEAEEDVSPPMPFLPITSPETVGLCSSLPLRPNDIFICSYPKSGTTWTQHIVLSLLMKAKENKGMEKLDYSHVSSYAPFYEVDQHWKAGESDLNPSIRANHEKLGRRVFNTHLRWDMLPKNMEGGARSDAGSDKARFIYIARSPMDVCLSFYCHLSNQNEGGYEGTFDSFFDEWMRGEIAFGSYIDHVLSFVPALKDAGGDREILLVTYEELVSDLSMVVSRIATFIEADVSKEDITELLPTFSFQQMKSDLDRFQPRSVTWKKGFQFLRKGVTGDSENVATDAQRHQLSDLFDDKCFASKLQSALAESSPSDLEKILALVR